MASVFFDRKYKGSGKSVFGLTFRNSVGLAAGFDKDAKLVDELAAFGFGFIEIGTVTPRPQPGNPKPRLFRLKKDQALINRMGFNNGGVLAAAERLKNRKSTVIVGGNIGKNKDTPNEKAWEDYVFCFEALYDHVDYFVVNVSSPNTPGLRALQEKESLLVILNKLIEYRETKQYQKPILLKVAPDLDEPGLDDAVKAALESGIDGLVAVNTTISREGLSTNPKKINSCGPGGLSGKPLINRSIEVVKYLSKKAGDKLPIIGVGGIHTANDVIEMKNAGASLVQLYSGFVYEGPSLVKRAVQAQQSK